MKRDAVCLCIVVIIVTLFHLPVLTGGSVYRGDIATQFYPWLEFSKTWLMQGHLPYWNPHTHAGSPYIANMQSAIFYPFNLILFMLPSVWFFGLSLLLHMLIAAIGTYWLARKCSASAWAASIAAIAYGLNGFAMIHIPAGNHLTYLGASWAPWLFLGVVGWILSESNRYRWLIATSVITALHFLCGHPQMMFYSIVYSLLFCFTLSLWKCLKEKRRGYFTPIFQTFIFGCFMLFGLGIASVQLFPTLEYLEHANRAASIEIEQATEFSFAPHRAITLLFPEIYGTKGVMIPDNHYDYFYYWSNAYAGVMIPLLALIAILTKKRTLVVFPLLFIGFCGLFLAWGRGNWVYELVYQLPGFGYFRAPAKFLPYYLIPVTVLAALGVDRLADRAYENQQKQAQPKQLVWSICYGFVLIVILILGSTSILNLYDHLRSADISSGIEIKIDSLLIGGTLLLSGIAIILLGSKCFKPRFSLSFGLLLLLCLDLFLFGRGYLYGALQPSKMVEPWTQAPHEVNFIKSLPDYNQHDRVATFFDYPSPNHSISWGLNNIAGYDPMSLKNYTQMISTLEGWEEDVFVDNVLLKVYDHPILDALNVRFILTRMDFDSTKIKKRFTGQRFNIYERTSSERSYAMIGDINELPPSVNWKPFNSFHISNYVPNEISGSLEINQDSWLRVSEWDYPGWKVTLTLQDGSKQNPEIIKSKEGFRVFSVPKEATAFRMYYAIPLSGWVVTSLCLGILVLMLLADQLNQREKLFHVLSRLLGRYY